MLNDIAALFVDSPGLFAVAAGIIGLMVGSFLNVVIYRLPIILERQWQAQASEVLATASGPEPDLSASVPNRFTLSTPRSACPVCRAPIAPWQNIPVLSWIYLKGKCAACKTGISLRYPLVELSTGLLSAWVAWHFGYGIDAACALFITWTLIVLTGIDIDHQLLPDDLTLPLLWAGLMAAALFGTVSASSIPVAAQDAILGAAAGYASLWAVFHAFRLITGKEGMGYGDFKLFAALGAWLGWKMLPLIIVLAAATGAVLGILMIVVRGRDRAAPIPFGPYLAAAGWLAMMYGGPILTGYLRLSGLKY